MRNAKIKGITIAIVILVVIDMVLVVMIEVRKN